LELWKELDEFYISSGSDVHLLELCGGMMIGKPDSVVIQGTRRSIEEHHLPHEVLDQTKMLERYRGLNIAADEIGLLEDAAGYLRPERCIVAHLALAKLHGAQTRFGEVMKSFRSVTVEGENREIVEVLMESGRVFHTRRLALTIGAWAPSQPELRQEVLGMSQPLYVVRKVLFWFKLSKEAGELYKNIPIYIWDLGEGEGNFYGFPALLKSDRLTNIPGAAVSKGAADAPALSEDDDYYELKVAYHVRYDYDSSGDVVEDPLLVERTVRPSDLGTLARVVEDHFPLLKDPLNNISHHAVCMYTMTHDEHFLIDFHPQYGKRVVVASPCSGHGYKFCSGIGEVIADMMTQGGTKYDISLFQLR
jgi:sarcosine oxidase